MNEWMDGCNCKGNCNSHLRSLGRLSPPAPYHNAYLMGTFHARPLKRVECFANDANRNELLLFIIASSSTPTTRPAYRIGINNTTSSSSCRRRRVRRENRLIAISTSIANIPIKKMQVNNSHCVWRWHPVIIIIICWLCSHPFSRRHRHIISAYGYVRIIIAVPARREPEEEEEHWNEKSPSE